MISGFFILCGQSRKAKLAFFICKCGFKALFHSVCTKSVRRAELIVSPLCINFRRRIKRAVIHRRHKRLTETFRRIFKRITADGHPVDRRKIRRRFYYFRFRKVCIKSRKESFHSLLRKRKNAFVACINVIIPYHRDERKKSGGYLRFVTHFRNPFGQLENVRSGKRRVTEGDLRKERLRPYIRHTGNGFFCRRAVAIAVAPTIFKRADAVFPYIAYFLVGA